jgi:hypothetical protein
MPPAIFLPTRSRRPEFRIERGFDFFGYHFSPAGLGVAKQTIANFIEKASRLYEQDLPGPPANVC